MTLACQPNTDLEDFENYPVYEGSDLGLTYTAQRSTFKVWAPAAEKLKICLYSQPTGGQPTKEENMVKEDRGVWTISFEEDLLGQYYTFQAQYNGQWSNEVPDPYAKAVGTNGKRGMIVDLQQTDPPGWNSDQSPPLNSFNDIIIYELHIRDLSMHPNSGIQHKGKFLGLAETGTKTNEGLKTGLDHIKALGITHIHLLPVYDFQSIDESQLEQNAFNWGYDPQNYNTPEGSYSNDPADGKVRIREFKQMVKALHENGLRVIMDVVYNHTFKSAASNFHQLVPGYYHRQDSSGAFSDASACGNETASERAMMRKFMLESVKYWVEEYHIDGFRFDLMGIHDIETMNLISRALHAIDPTIFLYGEGWTAGPSPLPDAVRALKANAAQLDQIAVFSDDIRDAIKGHVFTADAKGFISGLPDLEESLKFGIVASTQHPQIDYSEVNYSKSPWAKAPAQTITYASAHDNHTLWDRLELSCPETNQAEKIKMHKLAGAIVLTAQGVPFLHAGVEFARTKYGDENSFESPDSINQLDWDRKGTFLDIYQYYQALIQLRKNHPAFRMPTTEMIQNHLTFFEDATDNLVIYQIKGHANNDPWRDIIVAYNGNAATKTMELPEDPWKVAVDGERVDEEGIATITTQKLEIPGRTAMVLFQEG